MDGSYINLNTSISLNYSVSQNNLDSCWYSIDGGANISIPGCGNITFNSSEGNHIVTLFANSTAGLVGTSTSNFTIDLTNPIVALITPADGTSYNSNSQSIAFQYNLSETNLANCSLIINSVTAVTSSLVINGANSFIETLTPGNYIWNISCYDLAGNLNNSENRNFSITAVVPITAPQVPSVGGGGGGGGAVQKVLNLLGLAKQFEDVKVDVSEMNIDMLQNSFAERYVKLTNIGDKEKTFKIEKFGIDKFVVLEGQEVSLAPGETKDIKVIFTSKNETGIFTGQLLFGGKIILVAINVKSKPLLFDAMISIPDKQKEIVQGDKLKAQITLLPMGDDVREDATLNYIIKDYGGNIFLTESETVLVQGQKNFEKEFYTNALPEGNYVVGLEVRYPNGVATASANFKVTSRLEKATNLATLGLIILIVLISGIIIIYVMELFIARYKKLHKLLRKKR